MVKVKYIAFIVCALVVFTSCKENIRNLDTDVSGARSHVVSEHYFSEGFIWAHKIFSSGDFLGAINEIEQNETALKSITYTNTTYPVEVTLDFGTDSGNVCLDGRTRNGEIGIKVWKAFGLTKASIRATTQYYNVNGIDIEVVDSITNIGKVDGYTTFESKIRKGYLFNDTITVEWSANKTWLWSIGDTTNNYADDVFTVTNKVKALAYNGSSYQAETITPMIWNASCSWINFGTVLMQPANVLPREIDFGGGVCENLVGVKIGEKNYDIIID